jgi:hypothetical protein
MWEPEGMTEVYSQQKNILEVGDHIFYHFKSLTKIKICEFTTQENKFWF